jgi:hypothetical protein
MQGKLRPGQRYRPELGGILAICEQKTVIFARLIANAYSRIANSLERITNMKPENLKQVAAELKIDVPIMAIRALKDGFELHLYGGRVVKYTPKRQAAGTPKAGDAGHPSQANAETGDAEGKSQAQQPEPEPAQQPAPQPAPEPILEPSPEPAVPPSPEPSGSPNSAAAEELQTWTVAELRTAAAHMGIKNASRLTKAQLIQSLNGLQNELDEIDRNKDI